MLRKTVASFLMKPVVLFSATSFLKLKRWLIGSCTLSSHIRAACQGEVNKGIQTTPITQFRFPSSSPPPITLTLHQQAKTLRHRYTFHIYLITLTLIDNPSLSRIQTFPMNSLTNPSYISVIDTSITPRTSNSQSELTKTAE